MRSGRLLLQRRLPLLTGLLLTALAVLLSLQPPQWLQRLDYLLYDQRFNAVLHWQPRPPSDHTIAIVDIDEYSLLQEGRWPWSRYRLADLVQQLAQAGAVVVAFDVVFSEAERNPVEELRQRLPQAAAQLPQDWQTQVDADRWFARHFTGTDVVLGFFFLDQTDIRTGQLPAPVYPLSAAEQQRLVVISKPGYAANLPVLQAAAASGGFVTTFADVDGSVRRTPLLIRQEQALYPSLGLAAAMSYLFATELQLDTAMVGQAEAIRHVGISATPARTDAAGRVIVPYRGGSHSYPYYPAAEVLNGTLPDGALDGAIVLIGTSALGLADLRTTPVGTQYPGVEVHANVIDALLGPGFPYRPEWEAGATALLLLLTGLWLSFLLTRLGPVAAIAVSAATAIALVGSNYLLWAQAGLDLPLALLLLLTAAQVTFTLGYGFVTENIRRRQLRGMFDQYVPPAHIERMMSDPSAYQFAGESKELTVLFSDIRSFTSISEGLPATELKHLLNEYFTPVTRVIFEHEGTIDKYVGDMVMAFWGAPLDDPQHARHAVQAALAMQAETARLREAFRARGWPEIHIGIGLNSGPMNVGDMGSSYRRAYTVLGDAVNLGSRLESITKYYGVGILISAATRAQAADIACRFVDRIQVKGKEEPVDVYEPLAATSDLLALLPVHEQALADYRAQRWTQASAAFMALQQQAPCRLYELYLQRITDLSQQALPADWDGVFRHTEK